jgi:hypothetical protein
MNRPQKEDYNLISQGRSKHTSHSIPRRCAATAARIAGDALEGQRNWSPEPYDTRMSSPSVGLHNCILDILYGLKCKHTKNKYIDMEGYRRGSIQSFSISCLCLLLLPSPNPKSISNPPLIHNMVSEQANLVDFTPFVLILRPLAAYRGCDLVANGCGHRRRGGQRRASIFDIP